MNALAKPLKPAKYPAHLDYVRTLPCLVCGRRAEAHHDRSGLRPKDDRKCVPLCDEHHRGRWGIHGIGSVEGFQLKHGIWIPTEADRIEAEGVERGYLPCLTA